MGCERVSAIAPKRGFGVVVGVRGGLSISGEARSVVGEGICNSPYKGLGGGGRGRGGLRYKWRGKKYAH